MGGSSVPRKMKGKGDKMTTLLTAEDKADQLYKYVHDIVSKENDITAVMSYEEMMKYIETKFLELKVIVQKIKEERRQRTNA